MENNCINDNNDRQSLLKEIMEYDFMLADLNLYLDTHPCCQKSLSLFNEFKAKSNKLRTLYNEKYGSITIRDDINDNTWQWIENPWSWERMV